MSSNDICEDPLLACNSIVSQSQHLAKALALKREAVRCGRRRVAVLQQGLRDQTDATSRAHRGVSVERLRFARADAAVAVAADAARVATTSRSAALQQRDTARDAAVRITMRTEQLSANVIASTGLATRCEKLIKLVGGLTEELKGINEQLSYLSDPALATGSTTCTSTSTYHRQQLEACWLRLSVFKDFHTLEQSKSFDAVSRQLTPCQSLLKKDTEKRLCSLHQLQSRVKETHPCYHN